MGNDKGGNAPDELRAALVQAGQRLMRSGDQPVEINLAAVVLESGLSDADFRQCFQTKSHYLVALIESLLDELRDEIVTTTSKFAPGLERVWKSIETYLDGNLRRPLLRALIQEGQFDSLITEMARRRTYAYGMLMNMELASLKVRHPVAAGRLTAVMAVDAAVAEFEAGRALPELRESLRAFLLLMVRQ